MLAPYDAEDARGLLKAAIRDPDPVVFLENEILYGQTFDVSDEIELIPIGKANIIQEGDDVTIVSFSIGVRLALGAASELVKIGIKPEIIDLRSIRPLDIETIIKSPGYPLQRGDFPKIRIHLTNNAPELSAHFKIV